MKWCHPARKRAGLPGCGGNTAFPLVEEVWRIRAELSLEPAATSARQARRFVSETLILWGDDPLVESAALLVSELVTNAVIHARSEVGLVVSHAGAHATVRIEVRDSSGRAVRMGSFETDTTSGRGVALVDALAARWGIVNESCGKLVWFELDKDLGTHLENRQAG
jgi:anti-sigma regulatory factor (Ser/Thr protein kinase)